MGVISHPFTPTIISILEECFPGRAKKILEQSYLIQYINIKTKSATKGSKSRSSFANNYAIYVLVEDYLKNGFDKNNAYSKYGGAQFADLFKRQRELPFGQKLQNHALNHRLNEEFKKYFPTIDQLPVLRDAETNRYWFNENILKVNIEGKALNIALSIIKIIDAYIDTKRETFEKFITDCRILRKIAKAEPKKATLFISELLRPNVDARLFEIVSYAILKEIYKEKKIIWGLKREALTEESLKLYKTGRTNANDGGIDFVMKPLGRFFQVTETIDVKKYFLDIDKVEKYPLTFVIKSDEDPLRLKEAIAKQARSLYHIEAIANKYLHCIEEIINIPILISHLNEIEAKGSVEFVIDEIVRQSVVEFNYDDESMDEI